jgi:hypothetical protein
MLLCRDNLILLDVPELEPDRFDPDVALQGLLILTGLILMLICRDYLILLDVPDLEPDRPDPDATLQGLFDPFGCT